MLLHISEDKFMQLKSEFKNYNIFSSYRNLEIEFKPIPGAYKYFMKNNRPHTSLTFYNANLFFFLSSIMDTDTDKILISFFNSLTNSQIEKLKKQFLEYSMVFQHLITEQYSTTRLIPPYKNIEDKDFIYSIVSIYAHTYEAEDLLIALVWISNCINNENFENFNDDSKYRNRQGKLIKTNVINHNKKLLECNSSLYKLFNLAYLPELRHMNMHTDLEIDENKKEIKSIHNPEIVITYDDFERSMYALQQLQNYVTMFIQLLMINEAEIKNEGIIGAVSTHFEDNLSELHLFQLFAFFDRDLKNDEKVKNFNLILDANNENYLLISDDKEIMQLQKDDFLSKTMNNGGFNKVVVHRIFPDIYQTNLITNSDREVIGNITINDYGDYLVDDRCYIVSGLTNNYNASKNHNR